MFKNFKLKIEHSTRGISLPLITGLVTLLMVASVAVNELVIRSLRSVRGVESSARAYFAAEAGVEDGLYELTLHLAGYETPPLEDTNVRHDEFDTQNRWRNQWAIESRSKTNNWSGKILKNQKLIISLFADDNFSSSISKNAINDNAINLSEILNLKPSDFNITFSIPNSSPGMPSLTSAGAVYGIDNDEDGSVNEDSGELPELATTCENPKDNDCDGNINEDGTETPVILWKLTDNNGRSLIPLAGCLGDADSKTMATAKSELCERDFINSGGFFTTVLDFSAYGLDESGEKKTIGTFISDSASISNDRMQFEFLIVAPMEYVDESNKKIPIPDIQYEVSSSQTDQIPYHGFTLKSDGYYGTYKQSITTTITPKTTVPLFDFTIIQQK